MKQVWFTRNSYGEMTVHLEKPAREASGELHSKAEFPVPEVAYGKCVSIVLFDESVEPIADVVERDINRLLEPASTVAKPLPPPDTRPGAGLDDALAEAARTADRKAKETATKKAVKAPVAKHADCAICGKAFGPVNSLQKTCSPECAAEKNRRYAMAKYNAKKAAAAPKAATAADPAPVTRIQRIKAAAARLDGIPDGVRAAAAEARDCEAL